LIPLATTNPDKYLMVQDRLDLYNIQIVTVPEHFHEIQHSDYDIVLKHKAIDASCILGKPCLVDDVNLSLESYPGFPGTYTADALKLLGYEGFKRLVADDASRAILSCGIAIAFGEKVFCWRGSVKGFLRPTPLGKILGPGPLGYWFVPDEGEPPTYLHRIRALDAFGAYRKELPWD
jgi:inosine/xanthosine triphosphate pyrophosphatase family protein